MITQQRLLNPLKYVVQNSSYVSINKQAIEKFAKDYVNNKLPHWRAFSPFPYKRRKKDEDELDFLFLIGSQAFCFWGFSNKWTIEYKGKKLDGWWALIACFEKALEKGTPILDGNYLKDLTPKKTRELFFGQPEIPLLQERYKILKNIGKKLVQKYGGRFHNCYQSIKQDAFSILEMIITFEGFDDVVIYKGRKIHFYKKAQLVVTDIYESFKKRGFGKIANIDKLTGHADYKIPAILRKIEILNYSKKLVQKMDNRIPVPANSEMEIEIRANMLWAIHIMFQQLKPRFPNITPSTLCGILWGISQRKNKKDKPYHLTPTIYY